MAAARDSRCGASTKAAGWSAWTRRTTPPPWPSPRTGRPSCPAAVTARSRCGRGTGGKTNGEKIRSFVAHGPGTSVRAVAFARAGRLLVTSADGAGASGTAPARAVILWDPETGVAFRTIRNATHFALADDGRTLAVAGDASSIRVLDVITARELARLEGHEGGVTALAFAPGGTRLVSAGADRTVRVWALPASSPGASSNDRSQ